MGNLEALDLRTIRNVVRWLRSEGALSAEVSLPSGRGMTVYRSKSILKGILKAAHRAEGAGANMRVARNRSAGHPEAKQSS